MKQHSSVDGLIERMFSKLMAAEKEEWSRIALQFSDIPEVQSLYRYGLTFYVFSNEDQYRDGLMDRLLSVELEWKNFNNDYQFCYYPLALIDDPLDILPPVATLIWRR